MKIPKEKVKVKIKTDTSIIIGYMHIMVGGRLSDYISAQINKFIPITDAEIKNCKDNEKISEKNSEEVMFINSSKIESISLVNEKES